MGYRGGVRANRSKLAVLLTAGAAALVAAGCGGSNEQSQPASQSRPSGQGAQGSGDSGQSGSISQSTQSGSGSDRSTSIHQSSSGASSSSQSSTSGGGVNSFSGNGRTTLSFNVERPSRLAWTNSEGKPFSAKGGRISIDSRRGHGEIQLQPGDYNNVKVEGTTWTIVVRPR
jgi:hypothetical protein